MDLRLAVRRKPEFRENEQALLATLNNLDGVTLRNVTIVYTYDVFSATNRDIKALTESVVCDPRVDIQLSEADLCALLTEGNAAALGVEQLPGQYDQRADAANQALRLLEPTTHARIYSATLYLLEPTPSPDALARIRTYLINPVEAGEKDYSTLREPDMGSRQPLVEYPDFLERDDAGLDDLLRERGMAMNRADLQLIQEYFRSEGRTPTEVELAVLDTYWSDHCRHTTFNTELTTIVNKSERFKKEIDGAIKRWEELRERNGRSNRAPTLMDLGTIMGKHLRNAGILTNQEVSEEINACSVRINVDTPEGDEPWLLMFKNETHNHPTEIEPFGGAATCLGGAIRDPLSGRSWVYQALRLSGAGDINTPRSSTREGKLPQADISARATLGYSSYGNQIGLATTSVREFIHPGYVAKRMELGAVVAAAPEANVKRLEPETGDVVIILGGRTGRDGIGGATGSSKAHNEESLTQSGAEVQKGNPVNERKIQRLFRRAEVAQMIVRCNDFGAGGVCVAVGELADSLDIHLDRVPLKYAGLNAREIAISESQERMAVVVRSVDAPAFMAAAAEENLEATLLAEVTNSGRMRMFDGDELVVDLSRDFINTNGASREQTVEIVDPCPDTSDADHLANDTDAPYTADCIAGHTANEEPPHTSASNSSSTTSVLASLAAACSASQEGMVEQFDSTVGRSTVLMPYGGAYQKTDETASIQTLPVPGGTTTASIMTFGYSPALADESPYLMGAYCVVEALSRLVAAGGDARGAWLTVQEYFQRPDQNPRVWGDVLQALLGLLEAQDAFNVAAIGGKDSMSGSFGSGDDEIHVPPTLVTFAVAAIDARTAVSATLPYQQLDLYYMPHIPLPSGTPNYAQLQHNFDVFTQLIQAGGAVSASPILPGGLAATVVNMCAGNEVGFFASSTSVRQYLSAQAGREADVLSRAPLGGIVFAVDPMIDITPLFRVGIAGATPNASSKPSVIYLGSTTDKNHTIDLGFEKFTVHEALEVLEARYRTVFPLNDTHGDVQPLPEFATALPAPELSSADASSFASAPSQEPDFAATPNDSAALPASGSTTVPTPAPHVLLPVFPGTNSEYDMAEAFQAAGATTEFHVIRNLTPDMLSADTAAFIEKLSAHRPDGSAATDILAFSGGFSLGDEPDGSAKFIAAFLRADAVANAVKEFTARGGLTLGICNGFQALVKSGFLPYGNPDRLTDSSPTLTHNRQLRHVSRIATTRVATRPECSPWLSTFTPGQIHKVPVSHGEGRFVVSEAEARELFAHGRVAFQYVDADGMPTMDAPENPNGSSYAIEGIISPDGRILGKMGHPERYRQGLMRNIPGAGEQSIFANAVNYVRAHRSASDLIPGTAKE